MTVDEARAELAEYSKRLIPDGLATGTAGNLSVRVDDRIVVTPSGVPYSKLRPESMCVLDLDGQVLESELAPSSEVPMHLMVYRNSEAGAVVHTHSPYATTLSTVVTELPAIHYVIARLGNSVKVVPYATFGSAQLAENMRSGLEGRTAVLLQNHGTIAYGRTLPDAYQRSITLEWLACLYYRARMLGNPRTLTPEELDAVRSAGRTRGYREQEVAERNPLVTPPA